jgi:hypothetical protein
MAKLVHRELMAPAPSPERTKRYHVLVPGRRSAHPGKISDLYILTPSP